MQIGTQQKAKAPYLSNNLPRQYLRNNFPGIFPEGAEVPAGSYIQVPSTTPRRTATYWGDRARTAPRQTDGPKPDSFYFFRRTDGPKSGILASQRVRFEIFVGVSSGKNLTMSAPVVA